MALGLFDIHIGDCFSDGITDDNKHVATEGELSFGYVLTASFQSSAAAVRELADTCGCQLMLDRCAYIISFSGEYVDGDLADNYVVKGILTTHRNGDEWFISTFALDQQ